MIIFRKNPFSEDKVELDFIEGEKGTDLVKRALESQKYDTTDNMLLHFHLVLNGHIVDRDLWDFTKFNKEDNILVAPKIARGAGGQLFKQIAATVLIVVGIALLSTGIGGVPGAGLTGAGLALASAAVAVGVTLGLNALIPPPGLGGVGGLGSSGASFEGSQMYTITSQQNNAKKFGFVPRVYGSHRMFPLIAANPYTEIEADPATGNLVQFFYCIYDFGLGPIQVSDIKIGDTSITDYADASYRLVDFNKPLVSEGTWDDVLFDDLLFYKGDVERDGTVVALDKNQSDSGAQLDDYQVVRNASDNVQGNNQEISLDFTCPQGLIAYSTVGNTYNRTIELQLEFSKVGEDVWIPYNDINYVYDWSVAGGENVFSNKTATVKDFDLNTLGVGYTLLSSSNDLFWSWDQGVTGDGINTRTYTDHDNNNLTPPIKMVKSIIKSYGYPIGTTQILLGDGDSKQYDTLIINGIIVGVVDSVTSSIYPGYSWYNLVTPTTVSFTVFTLRERYVESQTPGGKDFIYATYLYDKQWVSSQSLEDKVVVKYLSVGAAQISFRNTEQTYSTFKFKPREVAAYKVRITRKNSFSSYSYRVFDKLTLTTLSTRFDRNPINTDKRHVFLEVKIRATNQLNGAIQNLSALAESVLDVYDPDTQTWSKQVTNNPAWVYCDLLTGIANKRAINRNRLHLDSILDWAEFCDAIPISPPAQSFTTKRFQCNFVLDFDTTLQGILSNVTNSAQASLNIIDGKYGVLTDRERVIPVQIFTPRNSNGFSSTRMYNESPHALKIRYIDPFKNWDVSEATVYDNGYDVNTATLFDEISTFACTNYEQAWRFGRYMLAQARLRKENITLEVDFEYMVCTRGDYVQITQDVMRAGGRPARVIEIVSVDTVRIDDGIDTLIDVDYGYVYRNPVDGIKTDSLTVINSDTFQLDGDMPQVGDLIIIGEVGKVVFDCIVKSINPSSDLTATLELVEKADDIYIAESSETIPDYDPQLTLNVDTDFATPGPVEDLQVVANTWRVVGTSYQYYIDIDWETPVGAAVDTFEIYVDSGKGYNLIDFTKESFYEYIVDPRNLGIPHNFKVLAVSSTGKKLNLVDVPFVTATPIRKVTPPSNVLSLAINITNQIIQLDWPRVTDADLSEYIIRYSPKTVGYTWESSIPLTKVDKNTTSTSVQGRTGTYFIKVLDFNGNESSVAALALTTIPNLFDLNVIEETNDFPDLEGELVTVVKDSGGLTLQRKTSGGIEINEYYEEGFYYYKDFLDVGDIYTVRLQSLVEAEGFTIGDLMSEWITLSDVLAMANAGQAQWDVKTQYRTTDSFNVMSDWPSLSVIDPISEGVQDNWTAWKDFIMGDATGRIFQFRLRLISYVAAVTPRVFDGIIRADMPDRFESYNNLTATNLGLEISYDPSFKGPDTSPNIQITQDNASQGDYYILENKTLDGFKITFYDKDGIAVTRNFDAAIKGFGRKALAVI